MNNIENIINEKFSEEDLYNDCMTIRKYAQIGKLTVVKEKHKTNINSNRLFKFIEACGITVEDYITGYLSVLQPYSMQRFQKNKNISKQNIWLIDVGYKTSLVIKVSLENEPIVVSFHESLHKENFIGDAKDFSDKKCAVITDKCRKEIGGYSIVFTIQRGFIRFTIDTVTTVLARSNVALVNYQEINERINYTMNTIYQRIVDTYTDGLIRNNALNIYGIDSKNLSISSIGFNPINNLCFLIDMYSIYTDKNSRFALSQIATSIMSEIPDKLSVIEVLKEKYINYSNKLYLAIISY